LNVGVVGCGIFGLAAALELCERGHTVTAFEQGPVPNAKASSFDTSKTIRRVYGADLTYVELVEQAAPRWRAWQERLNARFFREIGYVYIVRNFAPGSRVHDAWQLLSGLGRPEVELVPLDRARERFPQFAFSDGDTVLFDSWGGYLASGQAIADLARLAREEGVQIREATPVTAVEEIGSGVRVVTPTAAYTFDRVVVATGVWMNRLVPAVGQHIRVTRQFMAFFQPPEGDAERYAPGPMPVYSIESDVKGWYGHPLEREGTVKVANDLRGEVADPDSDREVTPEYLEQARAFVAERIPGLADAPIVGSRSCLYENTPDRDFVVDWAPGTRRIVVAGGGSGHGFKFGGSIGTVIADVLEEKENRLGERFRIGSRFG
jgi:glycine/D-amino acid oxidase-like deaminating enzyme